MIYIVLVVEVLLSVSILLTMHMIEYRYKSIQLSLKLYGSKRKYKTQTDIEWLDLLIKEYETNPMEERDLSYIIYHALQNSSIGKFPYVTVMNVASQGTLLMWGILVIGSMVVIINKSIVIDTIMISIAAGAIGLTIFMTLYTIIKALAQKEKSMIGEVIHYVKVTYPEITQKEEQKQILAKQVEEEKRRELAFEAEQTAEEEEKKEGSSKIIQMPREEKTLSTNKKESATLKAEDIAKLIGKI